MEKAERIKEKMDKMTRYIERTRIDHKNSPYFMRVEEARILLDLSKADIFDAICLAFNYGQAKGCRMARAEAKRRAHTT